MKKKWLIKTILMQVLCMAAAFGQSASCKYKPGPSHESIGGNPGCTSRCAAGPMKISPNHIEKCEDENIIINVRIEGGKMSTFGDHQENSGGSFDWGDGKTDGLNSCCSWDLSHSYPQAGTYYPSATFGEQHNNADNPKGGCSYRCRLQQCDTVIIHLKTSPRCKGGTFKSAAAKTKTTTPQAQSK